MNQDVEAAALIAEIDREASGEKERILEEARAKAREILAAADLRMHKAAEEAALATEKQARVDEDRLLGQTRMEADARRATGMQDAYRRVFEIAGERIAALIGSPRYPDALRALIREAVDSVRRPGKAYVAQADEKLCRAALKEMDSDCEVTVKALPRGSVIVLDADDTVKVDNSLGVRLAMAREVLETPIAKCLNG